MANMNLILLFVVLTLMWFYISSQNLVEEHCENIFTQFKETKNLGNFLCKFEREGLELLGSNENSTKFLFWAVIVLSVFIFFYFFIFEKSHSAGMIIFWLGVIFLILVFFKQI